MHARKSCLVFIIYFILCVELMELPKLNLDSVGQLGFIGDYAGLSPFNKQQQFEALPNNYSAILLQNNNAIFELLHSIQGNIETSCQLNENTLILAGTFQYNNTFHNIIQLDTQSLQQVTPIHGIDGSVHALYCDTDTVYIGGSFNNSALIYKNNQLSLLPWKGFNGPVYTIVKNPFTNSILFGGQFDSTGDGQYFNGRTSQSINLSTSARISSGNGALTGNNSNPSNLICSQQPWLLQDGVPGYWEATFTSTVKPSIFRLSNTHIEGRNTNEFNIMVLGSNEYFELSYNDPVTNEPITCTEHCYLSSDLPYQDFTVITPLPAKALRININSWDGEGGGLGGVEIFRSDVALQPQLNSNSNALSCSDTSKSSSVTTTGGDWTEKFDYGNYQDYLFNTMSSNDILTKNPTVTYQPFISSQGIYDIYVNTPGCVGTSSCDERTQVDLELNLNPSEAVSFTLDQRVSTDKRQLIYSGRVTATTDSFKPSITLRPMINSLSESIVSVSADSIEFVRNTNGSVLISILDYYPQENKWMPLSEQLPIKSIVRTIQPTGGDRIYIGGQFKGVNSTFSNIVSYQYNQGLQPLAESGLNGNVTTSLLVEKTLYIGGHFNNTINGSHYPLNNVAMYDIQTNTWSNLDQGVDDTVTKIFQRHDNTIHISGEFKNIGSTLPAFQNAQWNKTHFINPTRSLIVGPISTIIYISEGNTIYAGDIKAAQTYRANDASSIYPHGLDTLITDIDPNATVTAGLFWKNITDNTLITILGGRFHLNNTLYRIVINHQGEWIGHFENVDGEIHALTVVHHQLYIGGQFKGVYQNTNITSFAMFDLLKQHVVNINGIFDANKNPGLVNVIQSNGKQIYIGGAFAYAGFLDCVTICTFSISTRQWTQANQGIEGVIFDMALQNNDKISVVGDLKIKNTVTQMAHIESENTPWIADPSLGYTPTMLLRNENNEVLVAGRNETAAFLGSWNGNRLESLNINLGSESYIRQLLFIPIDSSSTIQGRYPSGTDTMLMAVGHLELPSLSASAALFDGNDWYPFLLSSMGSGKAGSIHHMFTQTDCCTAEKIHHYLSVPAVILISIAISLAMLFCMASIGFLIMFFKKKNNTVAIDEQEQPAAYLKPRYTPTSFSAMLDSVVQINTKGETTSGFSSGMERNQSSVEEDRLRNSVHHSFSALVSMALRNKHQSVASDEHPQIYYAKYPFEAKEFGELSFDTNTQIIVTDTTDHVWWMGYKDDGSDNPVSGLFPSNYVTSTKP